MFVINMSPLKRYFGEFCPECVIIDVSKFPDSEKGTIAMFHLGTKVIGINSMPCSPTRGYIPTVGINWELELGHAIAHEIVHYCQLNRYNGNVNKMITELFIGDYANQLGEIEADAIADTLPSEIKLYLARRIKCNT